MKSNIKSNTERRIRILHCPVEVGGQAWMISRAERRLGHKSDHMVFSKSYLGYPADYNLNFKKNYFFVNLIKAIVFLAKVIRKYDVFHFYYAKSILPLSLDLPILKIFRKKIFFTFQGSDIRRRGYFLRRFKIDPYEDCKEISHKKFFDLFRLLRLKIALFFANKTFVLNPDLKLISPTSELIPYGNADLNEWSRVEFKKKDDSFIILHAPTNSSIKGTKYLVEAVSRLKKEGYPVKLRLLEGIKHNQMKELCQDADIVVDQLLIGWYGGFAVETMALGKPVVCYINEGLSYLVPWAKDIPILNANVGSLYDKLKWMIQNPKGREKIGRTGRQFVEKWHDPVKIAEKLTKLYKK